MLILVAALSCVALSCFTIGYLLGFNIQRQEDPEETPRELVGDFDTRQELIRLSNPDEA